MNLETFLRKKGEMMVSELEEMRVIERMVKLNPGLISCPSCGGKVEVHHWKRIGKKKVPIFKCKECGFIG